MVGAELPMKRKHHRPTKCPLFGFRRTYPRKRDLSRDEKTNASYRSFKSMSDLSQADQEYESLGTGADGGSFRPTTASQHSSPSQHERTYWRRKGHQLSSWWSNLKKFAPQRLARSRSKDRKKKELMDTTRFSNSHPDVSQINASEFSEAFARGPHSAGASLTSSPKRMLETTPSPRASPFLSKRPSPRGSLGGTDSVSTVRLSAEMAVDHGQVEQPSDDVAKEILDGGSFLKHRHLLLRQHPFFELEVLLRKGQDLVARDSCGTSDPYVKFKMSGKLVYRSKTVHKNLNPEWNERFNIPIEDAFQPLQIKVFDYDWGLQDDFMGAAAFDVSTLEMYQPTDVTLELSEPGKSEVMGSINVLLTLIPRSQEDKEQYFHRNLRLSDTSKKLKSQIWSSVVTIVLVEGKNIALSPCSNIAAVPVPKEDSTLNPVVKFRLGNEKYKSKCAQRTCNPHWREQFDLHMFDDQSKILEINVFDGNRLKDEIGRCKIDLKELQHEVTHRIWKELEEKNGSVYLLLTISGTTNTETITDLGKYEFAPKEREAIYRRYNVHKSFSNLKDIGHLTVKVFRAQGLASADLGGKSDPFCVLELVNARLQTQTEYKTLSPSWNKIFTFNVKDIHSVLEITIFDEDRDRKVEFLGKVAVPLLRIKNGERIWYQLKDKKLHGRAKGQILLEMEVVYNPIRACVRTFNPKEEKFMEQEEKFKRQVFVNNVVRVKELIMFFIDLANYVQSCWEWESPVRSVVSFAVFLIVTYHFELYMFPIAFLLIFLRVAIMKTDMMRSHPDEEEEDGIDDEEDDDDKDKEEKKTLKERLQGIQEVALTVQLALGKVASVWESVKNTFNFSVPFLSWLAIIILCVAMVLLYLIPLRVIILLWGINKFTKKLRSPHTIPNNEILDFLSRVPDDEHLVMYKELRASTTSESERRGHKKKKSG